MRRKIVRNERVAAKNRIATLTLIVVGFGVAKYLGYNVGADATPWF